MAAKQRLGQSLTQGLEDGLHLLLCGAGGPMPDPERSGPCVAVIAGPSLVIVDAGSGGARNLNAMQFPLGEIDAQLLTHYHSDHIDGLGEMALLRWVSSANTAPLPVYGPSGVAEVVQGFNRSYRADAEYRNAHHGDNVAPVSGRGMVARPFIAPQVGELLTVLEQDGLTVSAFAVDHKPVQPAVGYRFDYRGRSLVISGDTAKSTNLEQFAKGVDLLVHEALSRELVGQLNKAAIHNQLPIIEKITTDILDYHASPVEAAESAETAGAKHLLYYHIVPPLLAPGSQAVFLQGVDKAYQGGVTVGIDGTLFSLPANSQAIEQTRVP
ncbi:MAG: MBL fold metallo-hydrolase [Cellvibrionaceae bacterium]|nr:MBL fold metallo-hydrolase [Cellvibrionaceae bacterium]